MSKADDITEKLASASQSRLEVLNGSDSSSGSLFSPGVANSRVSDVNGRNRQQQARTQAEPHSSPAPTPAVGLEPQPVFSTPAANLALKPEIVSDFDNTSSYYPDSSSGGTTDGSSGQGVSNGSASAVDCGGCKQKQATQASPAPSPGTGLQVTSAPPPRAASERAPQPLPWSQPGEDGGEDCSNGNYEPVLEKRSGYDGSPLHNSHETNFGDLYTHLHPLHRSASNKGYVNLTTMAKPDRCSIEGVRVHGDLLYFDNDIYRMPLLKILDDMQKEAKVQQRSDFIKFLQIHKLPFLAIEKQLGDISLCLQVEDTALQGNACFILEEIILQLQQSQDKSLTKELLGVAEKTFEALLKMNDNDDLLFNIATLHVMSVSVMFTRCERPDLEACSSFNLSAKGNKKVVSTGDKQAVFKSLHEFYHRFKDDVKELSPCPYWTEQQVTTSAEQDLIKDKSSRSSYFKLFMHTFSLLNEMARHGWSPLSLTLLNALTSVLEAAEPRAGKQKISQDSRSMIEFFIIRGLVVLLNTVYTEDREPFGNCQYDHQERISHMITNFIESCGDGSPQKERLLRQVRGLAFHKATRVRRAFSQLHQTEHRPLNELASGQIEHSLRPLGFRVDEARHTATDRRQPVTRACGWQASPCKLGDVKADCAMYLPAVNCMNKDDFKVGTCLNNHPGRHSKEAATLSEMHKQNLAMLQRLSPQTDQVSRLLAYQYKPFPFYITEAVEEEDRLLSFLCLHKKEGRWLDTKTTVRILKQIVDIVGLLENEGIVTRDLTCYNLAVKKTGRDQARKSRCQVLQSNDNFVIQLADLSLTHFYRNHGDVCVIRDHGHIPVRWTAPEALFEGRYSLQSMVWQIGCIMYEIATYGCEPYTSYRDLNTEDILKKMNTEPGSIRLFRWPCIPEAIMEMIESCTRWNPEERPSLEQLKERLTRMEEADVTGDEMPLEDALIMETQYPTPSCSQIQRSHVPEKGIPTSVQELIAEKRDSPIYKKVRILSWCEQQFTVIKDGELVTPEWLKIETKDECTIVKEKLSQKFVNGYLRLIESSRLPVKCWRDGQQGFVRLTQHDGQPVHEREYSASRVLRHAVVVGELSAPDYYELPTDDFLQPCLHVLVSLAKCMCQLHSQGWIIRDIQASNILVDCETGEAVPARIGRMCLLREDEQHYVDEPFSDCWRRLAPEVLLAKTYSRASDVFTFVTMIWEIFFARDKSNLGTTARKEDLEPCANIPRDQVISFVRENTKLLKPECCPEWLHQLVLRGRHPDPSQRPSAEDILSTLTGHPPLMSPPIPFLTKVSCDPVPEANTEEDTHDESQIARRKPLQVFFAGISKMLPTSTRRDVKTENFSQNPITKKQPVKVATSLRKEVRDPRQLQHYNDNTPQRQIDARKTKSSVFHSGTGGTKFQTEKKLRQEETNLKRVGTFPNKTPKKRAEHQTEYINSEQPKREHETEYVNSEKPLREEMEDPEETRPKVVDCTEEEHTYDYVDREETPFCLKSAVNDADVFPAVDKNSQKQAGWNPTSQMSRCRGLMPETSLCSNSPGEAVSLQTTGQNMTSEHAEVHEENQERYKNVPSIFLPPQRNCTKDKRLSNKCENTLSLSSGPNGKRPPEPLWKQSKETKADLTPRKQNRAVPSAITDFPHTQDDRRSNLFQRLTGERDTLSGKRVGGQRKLPLRPSSTSLSDTRSRAADACSFEGRQLSGDLRAGNHSARKKTRRETALFDTANGPGGGGLPFRSEWQFSGGNYPHRRHSFKVEQKDDSASRNETCGDAEIFPRSWRGKGGLWIPEVHEPRTRTPDWKKGTIDTEWGSLSPSMLNISSAPTARRSGVSAREVERQELGATGGSAVTEMNDVRVESEENIYEEYEELDC